MDAGEQDKNDERTLAQPSRPYYFHQPTVEEAASGHETGDAGEGIGEQLRQFEHVEKYLLDGGDEPHQRSEERRLGKECVSSVQYRWSPDHKKKKYTKII